MAQNAYLRVQGEVQGQVEGSGTGEHEGAIEVYGWTHEITSPRDAASGLPTGRRQHRPITIIKELDRASPLLMSMLVQSENITEWKLDIFRPDATGALSLYYTIELTNASVAGVRMESLNNRYEENRPHEPREHLSFTYQRITWIYADGGIMAEDDWETPTV